MCVKSFYQKSLLFMLTTFTMFATYTSSIDGLRLNLKYYMRHKSRFSSQSRNICTTAGQIKNNAVYNKYYLCCLNSPFIIGSSWKRSFYFGHDCASIDVQTARYYRNYNKCDITFLKK